MYLLKLIHEMRSISHALVIRSMQAFGEDLIDNPIVALTIFSVSEVSFLA